jgi:uncharacterized membrane protein
MAKPQTIGNMLAPWRFLLFLALLVAAGVYAHRMYGDVPLAAMTAFDLSAAVFLLTCLPLLSTRETKLIRQHAAENDANRTLLLVITGIVMTVLMLSIASETVGQRPEPVTKVMIIVTLILAWVFSNTVYAFHYAHLAYSKPDAGCAGLDFSDTTEPNYWDFVYFAFTLGMTFQTSDVTISDQGIRKVVTVHCLAAFIFNIGVLAFTINVLGSA